MKILVLFLSLSLLIGLFLGAKTNALPNPLALTVTTDKPSYRLQTISPSTINIGGNLTLNGAPVSGGLVAVTAFQGKTGHYVRPVLFRTLATGPIPPQNWNLNVSLTVLALKGIQYVPQTVFTRPSNQTSPGPAFNVTFKNTALYTLPRLYLTLTIFDAKKVPIAAINVTQTTQPIPPGLATSIIVPPTDLKEWVALGTATVYATAFDNIPPYVYFPYCPEVSKTFTVVPSSGSAMLNQGNLENPKQIFSSVNGNYNMAFNLSYSQAVPKYIPWGNYTVQVSSSYQGYQAANSYTFWVRIWGDINGDTIVNIKDVTPISLNWLKTVPPAPAYADLNGDGVINIKDVTPISITWLCREQPLP